MNNIWKHFRDLFGKGHPKNFYLRGAGAKVPADGLEAALPEIPDAIFDLQDQLR